MKGNRSKAFRRIPKLYYTLADQNQAFVCRLVKSTLNLLTVFPENTIKLSHIFMLVLTFPFTN